MRRKLIVYFKSLREHLWFKPLLFCLASVVAALIASRANGSFLNDIVPSIKTESIEGLLDTISASMLVISTFAVASMVSAFSAASNTATPRSFKIVVTDDVSQYALSTFIGAFIFSIVARVALSNGYYDKAGRFILFILTLLFFVVVILTFIRWVDRISRLGRLEHTISQVESISRQALAKYIKNPLLGGLAISDSFPNAISIKSESVGFVQYMDIQKLHNIAEDYDLKIQVHSIPGKFIHLNSSLVSIISSQYDELEIIRKKINDAFNIGHTRLYDDDPRFGIIALTEIASRALSPGINDPGTAIQIIGSHERLFFLWQDKEKDDDEILYDRIEIPEISMSDFFIDAFRPIARDGADNIEVMLRLQKAFKSLNTIDLDVIKGAAEHNSKEALDRAKMGLKLESDFELLKNKSLCNEKSQ